MTTEWKTTDICCPGCGIKLPTDNKGCPSCGWEDNTEGEGTILTIGEIIEGKHHNQHWPCPAFMRAMREAK